MVIIIRLATYSILHRTHYYFSLLSLKKAWIWTEPHSMRLKVRLTIQKGVQKGTILQQAFTVIFVVRNQQCIECQAEFRQGSWKSLVQIRQRVSHKRTFLYLEQLILKHGGEGCHDDTLSHRSTFCACFIILMCSLWCEHVVILKLFILLYVRSAHRGCLSIETFRDGMDFYFPDKGKAARFISFLDNVVPTKVRDRYYFRLCK